MEEKVIFIAPKEEKEQPEKKKLSVPGPWKKLPRGVLPVCGGVLLLILLVFGWYQLLGPGSKRVTVYLNSNGGEELRNLSVRPGASVKLPEPEREGYQFLGWSLHDKIVSSPFSAEEDVVLMAEWEGIPYVVTFDANGGTPDSTMTLRTGDPLVYPGPAKEPIRKGFTLNGWADAAGKVIPEGTVLESGDITLYAVWAEHMFRITFDSDGGTNVPSMSLREGDVFHTPAPPTRTDYEFVHWVDQNGVPIEDGALLTAQDITLTAVWKQTTYMVVFDSKGGSFVTAIQLHDGDKLKLPADPIKDGYRFVHWEDKNQKPILDGALLAAEDITLYAVWEEDVFIVSFDSRGGTDVEPIKLRDGQALELPAAPTKNGFRFGHWEDVNGVPILDGAYLAPEDIKLYAVWQKVFTVSFDSRGGSYVAPIELEDGEVLKLPSPPTREGYNFDGWVDANDVPILDGALLFAEDITLYARWS